MGYQPKPTRTTLRAKEQFLLERELEAAKQAKKRRNMVPWNGKDEGAIEVEVPWDGKK